MTRASMPGAHVVCTESDWVAYARTAPLLRSWLRAQDGWLARWRVQRRRAPCAQADGRREEERAHSRSCLGRTRPRAGRGDASHSVISVQVSPQLYARNIIRREHESG